MKRSNITLSDIARWRKQGRGCGEGNAYKPWVRVRDVPSKGRSSRIKGMKTHRVHHLLSDLETNHFLHLDFNPKVIDIREQYPLFPLDEAMAIAHRLGITYPRYPGTTTPVILTTDFLITYRDNQGEIRSSARTIKYRQDLLDKRVREKLEIERVFWQLRGVHWQIGTDDLNQTLVTNLNWLRPHLHLVNTESGAERLPEFHKCFLTRLNSLDPLKELIKSASTDAGVSYQIGLRYFRFMAWHRLINLDLENALLELRSALPVVSDVEADGIVDSTERRIA